ncbi:MAG: hypothetical protein K6G44_17980 [Lentisphaeria bacterium]|nr:hypothetical protein [Lentisphaeria bacterium]
MKIWPVLKHYDQQHVAKIALPLGGIGTGTLSLGGRGDFRDCEIMNTPAKGAIGVALNFCVQAQPEGGKTFAKLLEGPFSDFQYEGPSGATAWNHRMPRFRHVTFDAAYPFGQVNLEDDGAPLSATLQAFNPLIASDADASVHRPYGLHRRASARWREVRQRSCRQRTRRRRLPARTTRGWR